MKQTVESMLVNQSSSALKTQRVVHRDTHVPISGVAEAQMFLAPTATIIAPKQGHDIKIGHVWDCQLVEVLAFG